MKKLSLTLSAAAALVAATVGFAAPAMAAAPGYEMADCSVHVVYQGANVDVDWC